mgnify:CR=1 FL=1
MSRIGIPLLLIAASVPALPALAGAPEADVLALMKKADDGGQLGTARKSKPVDARPAKPGEVVVTIIKGQGKETESAPAEEGDWVVRNRCPETGNEEILVKAKKFQERYDGPTGPAGTAGWQPFTPRGLPMRYLILPGEAGEISFIAPWGEPMIAKPGDAIVQDPNDPKDTYRIAAAAFSCTYDIIDPAKP